MNQMCQPRLPFQPFRAEDGDDPLPALEVFRRLLGVVQLLHERQSYHAVRDLQPDGPADCLRTLDTTAAAASEDACLVALQLLALAATLAAPTELHVVTQALTRLIRQRADYRLDAADPD